MTHIKDTIKYVPDCEHPFLERPKVGKDLVVHIGPRISQIADNIPMHFIAESDQCRPLK